MSIFSDCYEATRWLLADEDLHSFKHPGFFTELDVIALASDGYTELQMRRALTECSTMLTKLYGRGGIARFGPVLIPGLPPDYARIASKIVYAHPEGPAVFETPNGNFKRLMAATDTAQRVGKRHGTNRDDRFPWSEQNMEEARNRAILAKAKPRKRSRA